MTRGRQPVKAQDEAIPIAGKRGLVQRYQHRRGNVCEFSIMSPGLVSFICVRRLDRLTSLPEDIAHDFTAVIGLLRFIASSPAISRELWLRTPHGVWRFFRVCDAVLLELDRDGMPLTAAGAGPAVLPVTGARLAKKPKPARQNGKKSARGKQSVAGKEPALTENPAPDPTTAKNPEPEKDLKPATMPEKISEQVKDPGPVKKPEPNSKPAKDLEHEKDLKHFQLPEKISEPVKDPGPQEDPTRAMEPEKIPDIIRKFLERRKSGLVKDPESV